MKGVLSSLGQVLETLGEWLENPDIRFLLLLILMLVLTYRIIASSAIARQHDAIKKAVAVILFVMIPVWTYTNKSFREMMIAQQTIIIIAAAALAVMFVLTNVLHVGGWGESFAQRSSNRFRQYTKREKKEERGIEKTERSEEKGLRKIEREEKKEGRIDRGLSKAIEKTKDEYARAHKAFQQGNQGDPEGIKEGIEHMHKIREIRTKLREHIGREMFILQDMAIKLMLQRKLSDQEKEQLKRQADFYVQEQAEAGKIQDAFREIEVKDIKEGLEATKQNEELEERIRERLQAAYYAVYQSIRMCKEIEKMLDSVSATEDKTGEELLRALEKDYGDTETIRKTLERITYSRVQSATYIRQVEILQERQSQLLKQISREQQQEEEISKARKELEQAGR